MTPHPSFSADLFHPLVARWFARQVGVPTAIQKKVWPMIAGGRHVLVTAPTGSGKTLAAFLWALDRLIRGGWDGGQTRILYVSPLKALNNDIRRNLIRPLEELRQGFTAQGEAFPEIRVATRSGDTTSSERRAMIRRPPEILITTPESLHLLLASHGGRTLLGNLRTVILDEIHAVAGNKRGSLLMAAVDRLVPLCGEFQRIALSATLRPVETVAAFVGGFEATGDPDDPDYIPRVVHCCQAGEAPAADMSIHIPKTLIAADADGNLWDELAGTLRSTIDANRATLIFTNSRRLCEKLTFLINQGRPAPIAYAHHGSLSKALRLEVEQRLKNGALKAIVATSSLELGIDIGDLDQVILIQTPPSVASALQRIGRSGHGIGRTRRATFVPSHAVDGITAAVVAAAVQTRDIEPLSPIDGPLDVLAQVLVAMVGLETWDLTRLFNTVRTSWPFHRLTRPVFDLVVQMLAGRYAAARIPALFPKVTIDRLDNTIAAVKGALLHLYTSGGVIPNRGYYTLRDERSGARIGELDEEFVWEARNGQVFTLGTQNWRIQRITDSEVRVRPARPATSAPPFWRAEAVDRDVHLSKQIGCFLETAQAASSPAALQATLCEAYPLDDDGARYIADFLDRQRQRTGCALPHRHHIVVEIIPQIGGGNGSDQIVIHTFWGGRVNRPLALAICAAWENRHGHAPAVFPTNDAIHLILPEGLTMDDDIFALVPSDRLESLVRQRLEGSGGFGARFRECAARALLLPGRGFNRRMPLWLTRKRAQRLMDAVRRFADFPILIEAWRSCIKDDFDLPALAALLGEIETGKTAVSVVRTRSASPMALAGAWRMVNQYMYEGDQQPGSVTTGLSPDLLQQILFTPELRPAVAASVVTDFVEKRQRLAPGYPPSTTVELLAWVRERLLIPADEWRQLLQRAAADGVPKAAWIDGLAEKALRLVPPDASNSGDYLVVAAEDAPFIARTLYPKKPHCRWLDLRDDRPRSIAGDIRRTDGGPAPDGAALLAQWLRFYGPLGIDRMHKLLGMNRSLMDNLLTTLIDTRSLVSGHLVERESDVLFCDADNFETLLRMARRRKRETLVPRPVADLAPLLARQQGIIGTPDAAASLDDCLSRLACLVLPAALWETEILPARRRRYDPHELDRLLQTTALMWIGAPGRRLTFCHATDLDLIPPDSENSASTASHDGENLPGLAAIQRFPAQRGRYTVADLMGDPPESVQTVLAGLWEAAWAGRVTNDSMSTLRHALSRKGVRPVPSSVASGHGRFGSRRQRRRPVMETRGGAAGCWRIVPAPPPSEGRIAAEELSKERVRVLLDRYGILFRELLAREHPAFQWAAIFRTLRLMELAGEVVGGLFFDGLPGPQFASPPFINHLRQTRRDDAIFWICAQDPASLCGLGIAALAEDLPRRVAGTHLVYRGNRLVLVSMGWGHRVSIRTAPDDPHLFDCLTVFDHLLDRPVDPRRRITIDTINAIAAPQSPFLYLFSKRFDTLIETHCVTLYTRREV